MIHGLDLDDTSRPPFARLSSSGLPINAGQEHKVWRGLVQVEGSMEPAVPVALKLLSTQVKLAIELGCSLAGPELGLPVPRGVIVLAWRDQLPGLPASAKRPTYLCFGSVHQWPDDTSTRMLDDAAAAEHTWRHLCSTSAAAAGAAWDELAANADRHHKNLLFDGAKYWLIDHELALKPLAKVMRTFAHRAAREALIEHRAPRNQIADELQLRRGSNHDLLQQGPKFGRAESRLKLLADQVRQWSTGRTDVDAVWPITEIVLRGIALRLPALALMLSQRLKHPTGPLLWTSSSQNSSSKQ